MFKDKVLGENTCHKREEKKLDDGEHYTVRSFRICEFWKKTGCALDSTSSEWEPAVGSCEHNNEPLG
jgi:hypothetical protein